MRPPRGRKRRIVTDTPGYLIGLIVRRAETRCHDGAPTVLKSLGRRWTWLRHLLAVGGYAGPKPKGAIAGHDELTIEIIKRSNGARSFEVLQRGRVVERTFAWLGHRSRLARDREGTIVSAIAVTCLAHIRLPSRRIARHRYA